jgi:Tol biopolymer transport system component
MVVIEQGNADLWVYDLRRDAMMRLTSSGGAYAPTWSPDSRYVFFHAMASGIFWTRSDGAGEPRPLTGSRAPQVPWSLTADGKRLAYVEDTPAHQIWTVPLQESNGQVQHGKPEQFLKTRYDDFAPAFSPDGKWMAYVSNATGSYEVFVRCFPDTGARWQISTDGGTQPVWLQGGRDLLYQSGDQIMAVAYTAKKEMFVAEKPRVWLEKLGGTAWDLAPDGKRVAVVSPVDTPGGFRHNHEVVFLLNFCDELRRRVPFAK